MSANKQADEGTLQIGSAASPAEVVAPASASVYAGKIIGNRYLIQKELGRGGIGVVFLCHDQQLHARPVVIKVLLDDAGQQEWFKKKFEQEVEALARIDHPGVVGVFDAGQMPDGKPYLVMQYVEGADLRSVMRPEGMAFETVGEIMRQIGHALGAAHGKGIFHRDLKPENIMLQSSVNGQLQVKLIDFGIAAVKDSQVATNRETTAIAGTLPYMAPEQLMGKPSAASDIYALGVIAYEMLTGQRPFTVTSPYLLLDAQRAGVEASPQQLRHDLPAAAQEVVLKALCFDAADRPPSARDFGDALAKVLTLKAAPISTFGQEAAPFTADRQPLAGAAHGQTVDQGEAPSLEIAHVLFMDIVGYSKLEMNEQTAVLGLLKKIVRDTIEFRRAQAGDQLISLPTGDGMALVFFGSPLAPVHCALEIARELKNHPALPLRMGVHSGLVYHIADINANKNVAGGGINIAQRVMDCGDAGHILLSKVVADFLIQVGSWAQYLTDLGERQVKHGVRVHLFNLCRDGLGNPAIRGERSKLTATDSVPWLTTRRAVLSAIGVAVLIIGLLAGYFITKPLPATPPTVTRQIAYSITLQRNVEGRQQKQITQLPGAVLFATGDQIRLKIVSNEAGWLYILDERPEQMSAGVPKFNLLFPTSTTNSGSSRLVANEVITIPSGWFVFDAAPGAEKVWLVWSNHELPELEALKRWTAPGETGEIKDSQQIIAAQALLDRAPRANVMKDDDQKQTVAKTGNDVLVHFIELNHL